MKKTIRKLFTIKPFESLLTGLLKIAPNNFFLRGVTPACSYYIAPSMRHCKRYGINYNLDISDYQNWLLYFFCNNDSSFGVLNYIKKDDVVLDVGGNIGQTALMIAKSAGENSKVFSFEPFPNTYEKFVNNLGLNPALKKNIIIENCALGDTPTTLKMYRDCETNSGSYRVFSGKKNVNEVIEVPVSTIDDYIAKNRITKLNLIKIDVEGFEMNVLRGAINTLKEFKPKLFIEVDSNSLRDQNTSALELISFLKSYNYKVFKDGETKELDMDYSNVHIDIYCE